MSMDPKINAGGFKSKVLLIFAAILCLSEADKSRTPHFRDVLSISSKCSTEITLELKISGVLISSHNSSHAVSDGDEVEIICRSPTPVYLRYIGYPLLNAYKWKLNSSSERINENCFSSRIEFKAEKDFTGEYECQEFGLQSSQTSKSKSSVYIYVDANEPYLLLDSKGTKLIEIHNGNRDGLILPCAVSNPSTAVDLQKNNKNITDLYPFDPKLGFLVNSTTEYGLFKCTVRGSNSYLEVNVVEPKANEISSAIKDKNKTSITLNMYKNKKQQPTFECVGASSMIAILCNTPIECDFFRQCVVLEGLDYCNESTKTGKACEDREDCRFVTFENSMSSSGGIIFCSNRDSEVPAEFKFFVNNKAVPMLEENATSNDTMNFGLSIYGSFINYDFVYFGEPPVSMQCNASKNVHSQGLQWGFVVSNTRVDEPILIYPQEDKNETLANVYSRTSGIAFNHPELLKLHGKTILFFCRAPRIDSTGYDVIYHPLRIEVTSTPSILHPKQDTIYLDSENSPTSLHPKPKHDTIYLDSENFDPNKPYVNCTVKGNDDFYWTKKNGNDFVKVSRKSKQFTKRFDINGQPHTYSSITVELTGPENPITYRCEATNGQIRDITVIFTTKILTYTKDNTETYQNDPEPTGSVPTSIAAVLGFCLFVLTIITIVGGYRLCPQEIRLPKEFMDKFYKGHFERFEKARLIEESDDGPQENPEEQAEGILIAPHDKQNEISPKDVTKSSPELIGSGQFGSVYLAIYRRRQVVWKEPNKECQEDNNLFFEFLKEIKFMEHVGHHENIVEFIGCMASRNLVQKRKAVIIMEFCALGDLQKYLEDHRPNFVDELQTPPVSTDRSNCGYVSVDLLQAADTSTPQNQGGYVELQNQIFTSNLIQWAYEIACGLEFLASKKFIHRDVAARNVLLTEDRVAKITDFGLARFVEGDKTYYRPLDEPIGNEDGGGNRRVFKFPIPWLSIESIRTRKFSEDSDIWAFGVTLWEIFSLGEQPFRGSQLCCFPHLFADYLAQGYRLPMPRAANEALYDIMTRCWAPEGKDRPRFTELKELINDTKSYLTPFGTATTAEEESELESCDNSDASSISSHRFCGSDCDSETGNPNSYVIPRCEEHT